MKRSRAYPTFRYWLNDETDERVPITAENAQTAHSLSKNALPTDGSILIGSSSDEPVATNLTAGTGISIHDQPGAITISNTQAVELDSGELLIGFTGQNPAAASLTAGEGIAITNAPGAITISQNLLAVSKTSLSSPVATTSESDITITGMTISPGVGDYLVFFDGMLKHDSNSVTTTISLYVNGQVIPYTVRTQEIKDLNNSEHIGTMAYVTGVLEGQIIDVRWKTNAPNTSTMDTGTIIAIKLAE